MNPVRSPLVPGLDGSFVAVAQVQANAGPPMSNPQGLQPVFASFSAGPGVFLDSYAGGALGGFNAPPATSNGAGGDGQDGSPGGTSGNRCMSADQLNAHRGALQKSGVNAKDPHGLGTDCGGCPC